MRSIKSIIKGAVHRIKESCLAFGRKATIAFCTFTFAVSEVMAGSKVRRVLPKPRRKSVRMRHPFPT